ncbi:MAG: CHAT domain-containing protein [Methylococcales bacterium]
MKNSQIFKIGNVKLELLRPGPAHNQLLSPLTPYIALCGADGPVTVHLPFEHRQLLMRLRRLRYLAGNEPAAEEQRQGEIRDIGETIGQVLGQVPALLAELGNACVEQSKLIHLRLALSGFELGMIPFEAAIAPDGYPGSGSPLFLQMRTPISITREIRRGRPLPVEWNRPPRILFAYAGPGGLYVPAQEHLQALREAIEPWVKIKDNEKDRLPEIKKILTILPNASLEKIRKECANTEYTHVHILAHGAEFKNAGEEHYGVALCNEYDQSADIVDGERLAIALTARDSTGTTKYCPTMVTLATCDSGNIDTVITPGGSIAHELNAAGIPWIIASQFPLWMKASAIAAEVLYKGLLSGKDPRWVLYELRQRLRTDSPGTHDWASIVAYSTVPWNFEAQVNSFRDKQTRRKLDVKFARIDELVGANDEGEPVKVSAEFDQKKKQELEFLCESIRKDLKKWREEPDANSSSKIKAERLGLSAASEKRIGVYRSDFAQLKDELKSKQAYEQASEFYFKAIELEPSNHWVSTQHLSVLAVLSIVNKSTDVAESKAELHRNHGATWVAVRQIAKWQYRCSDSIDKAWTLTTQAELHLLGSVFAGDNFNSEQAKAEIQRCCKEVLEIEEPDSFAIFSTKRQFRRYTTCWKNDIWTDLAKEALIALGEKIA